MFVPVHKFPYVQFRHSPLKIQSLVATSFVTVMHTTRLDAKIVEPC